METNIYILFSCLGSLPSLDNLFDNYLDYTASVVDWNHGDQAQVGNSSLLTVRVREKSLNSHIPTLSFAQMQVVLFLTFFVH